MHRVVVERLPQDWGLGDGIDEYLDRGYVVKKDGARRVTLEIPMEKFKADQQAIFNKANERLVRTAAPDIADGKIGRVSNHVKPAETPLSSEELAAGIREKENDLNE
jgi:hypothetical protein